jgi:hypothetical protein
MIYRQTFTVRGCGDFPFDMLRYDRCYPASELESDGLDNNRVTHCHEHFNKPREVKLARWVELKTGAIPTTDRWRSFGWTVVENSVKTERY